MANKAAIRFSGLVDIPANASKTITLPLNDCYAGLLYVRAYRSTASTYLTHKLFYFLATSLTQVNTFNGSAGGVNYSVTISQTANAISITITNNESTDLKCNVNVLNMFAP